MPRSQTSLRLTDSYRRRLVALGNAAEAQARALWPTIEELDSTSWPEQMARTVAVAQRQGVRLTMGYLAAYARSEGASGTTPKLDAAKYVGLSRDGRPLSELFTSPLIGVRAALKQGRPASVALNLGLTRGTRSAAYEAIQTPRDALLDTIEADPRFTGFQRSVAGTCAACMALSGTGGPHFEVHPSCQCVPAPTVAGASNRFPIPTGAALFKSLTKEQQDEKVGAEAAALIRDGQADLKDFVAHSRLEEQDEDFITQKPVQDVATT